MNLEFQKSIILIMFRLREVPSLLFAFQNYYIVSFSLQSFIDVVVCVYKLSSLYL